MRTTLASLSLVASLLTGCYATARPVGYGYQATAVGPNLAYIGPNVQVVSDYDYPVFYSDNYYWRYDGGLWYRSSYHTGGWSVWNDVPVGVRSIDRPYGYVHYRGGNNGYRQPAYNGGYNGGYRQPPPVASPTYRTQPTYQPAAGAPVRDHRENQPMARPAPAPAPVRDHRHR
jgi:hypothetical protein